MISGSLMTSVIRPHSTVVRETGPWRQCGARRHPIFVHRALIERTDCCTMQAEWSVRRATGLSHPHLDGSRPPKIGVPAGSGKDSSMSEPVPAAGPLSVHDQLVEALLSASRVMVGLAARSLADLDSDVTLPQYRALVVLA